METAVKVTKVLDRILSIVIGIFIMTILSYAVYCLWDNKMINDGAYLDDEIIKFKPRSSDDRESLEELLKINPDVVGWLTVEDTKIDYPFVRGKDNLEYVNKDIYGEFSFSGSIFLDSSNNKDLSDSYNLLYGHNVANGCMFGDLNNFDNEDYFTEHTKGEVHTILKYRKIDIFASIIVDANDPRIFYPANFSEDQISDILSYIKDKAKCYRDINMTPKDKIIALSTCRDNTTKDRIVVFGKLED